jgi:hypothetical protein
LENSASSSSSVPGPSAIILYQIELNKLHNIIVRGGFMNRSYCILFLLIVCMATSNGKDWLDGGYVGRGGYGDVGQYFNDPLFYPQGTDPYAVADPAVRNMLISLDMPRESIPGPSDPAIRQMEASLDYPSSYRTSSSATAGPIRNDYSQGYNSANIAGRLQIILSDGTIMDLMLYQYQNTIYGQGSVNHGGKVQWATVKGYMYGNNLQIDVMPANDVTQYAISIDTARRDMPGRFTIYRYGTLLCSGTANARWMVA